MGMYNKLFTKILDSSIWLASDATRIVWITLIAAMDEDGFCAFATVENLAARARIELKAAKKAVQELESPEPETATHDNDGRRIERVPGGWMVLNAPKYRDMVTRSVRQGQIRKRVAEFRTRKRVGLDAQISEQNGTCDCCNQPFEEPYSLYVVQDHDHKTGGRRGAICQSCNKVVGLIELGKPTISDKTSQCKEYIEKWSNAHVTHANAPVTPSEAEAVSESKAGGKGKPPSNSVSGEKIQWEGIWWFPDKLQKQLDLLEREIVKKQGDEYKTLRAKINSVKIALRLKVPKAFKPVVVQAQPERPPPTPEEGKKLADALRAAVENG